MPDICDLILDDHEELRRRFAEMDENRSDDQSLTRIWEPLGSFLDLHAAAEEEVFYPLLVRQGHDGGGETTDAIKDHNQIRDAVADAGRSPVGTDRWWSAVGRAREQNSDHMAEEERGALADFRSHTAGEERDRLGARFVAFKSATPVTATWR